MENYKIILYQKNRGIEYIAKFLKNMSSSWILGVDFIFFRGELKGVPLELGPKIINK